MFYHTETNQYINYDTSFSLNGVQYPSSFLRNSTIEDKTSVGLVEVITVGDRGDDRYVWVNESITGAIRTITNTPKSDVELLKIKTVEYTTALEQFYDKKAQERKYDNRYTCALRAGYAGPFQPEGVAFAQWMDTCNGMCYQMLTDVQSGTIPLPTIESVIQSFPDLIWP
jgi:hypothetical protein